MSILVKVERWKGEPDEYHEFNNEASAIAFTEEELKWEGTAYITRFNQVDRDTGDFQGLREDNNKVSII